MKLPSLTQSVRPIGLVAMLSLTVGIAASGCTNSADTKAPVAPMNAQPAPSGTDTKAPMAAQPTPSGTDTKAPMAPMNAQPAPSGTIVEVAAGNPSFSTLVTAVKAAGLAETLSGKGPFTVFAPTNEAFAALPKGTLEKLLKPENQDLLKKVLTYHVVSGDLMAKDLQSGKVATVEGRLVAVQVGHGTVKVNDAKVIKADVDAKNGVIHVIDRVLLPPNP
jgi:uncharacterized surface protein with fasciclin (FAS1) repeats